MQYAEFKLEQARHKDLTKERRKLERMLSGHQEGVESHIRDNLQAELDSVNRALTTCEKALLRSWA